MRIHNADVVLLVSIHRSAIKSISSDDISNETNPRQILEEDYLKAETKV